MNVVGAYIVNKKNSDLIDRDFTLHYPLASLFPKP